MVKIAAIISTLATIEANKIPLLHKPLSWDRLMKFKEESKG